MLKLGNINISKVYIGETPAPKGFLGETQVWGQTTPVVTMTPDFVVHYYVKPEGETLFVARGGYTDIIDKVGRYNLTTGQYEVIEYPAGFDDLEITVEENEPFQYGFTLKNKTVMDMMPFSDNMDVREIDLHTLTTLRKLTGSIAFPFERDPNDFFIDLPNTVQRFENTPCVCATVRIWDNGAYRYGLPSGVTYIGMPEGREEDEGLGGGAFDGAKLWSGDYSDIYEFIIPASVTHLEKGAFANAQLPPRVTVNSTVGVPDYLFDSASFGNGETANFIDIKIAEGNTSVGDNAFMVYGDTSHSIPWVYSLSLPSTLITIGDGAFAGMMFSVGLDLPSGLTTIGEYAFARIYQEEAFGYLEITIPASVTTIGAGAFDGAEIKALHFNGTTPAAFTDEEGYGIYPFDNCHTRETDPLTGEFKPTPLYVPCEAVDTYKTAWSMYADRISCQRTIINPDFDVYYQQDGENDWQIFNPALIALIDKIGVYNDDGECEEYDIPSDGILPYATLTAATVQRMGFILKTPTALDTSLFDGTDAHEIDGIVTTAPWTRVYNSLSSVVQTSSNECLINLPDTVQRVEDYGCAGFIVSLPDGTGGFEMNRLPSACTYIGDYAFEFAKLMYDDSIPFEIPARVTHIGEFAFEGAYLPKTINFNATIGVPDEFMFQMPFYVSNVNIAEGNTSIGAGAFHSVAIKDFSLPSTLRTIGDDAFYGVRMQDGDGDNGSGITIPAGVTSIGSYAFQNAGIPAIYFNGTTPATIGTDVFTDCITPDNTPTPIYVPCSAVDTYKAAAGWSTYADQIQCIPSPEPPEASEYFHFIALQNGAKVSAPTKLSYSLDGGNTWVAGDGAVKTLSSGATIYFKGSNSSPLGYGIFGNGASGGLEVRGNIMSLLYNDLFQNYSVLPCDEVFKQLFGYKYNIIKADKLVLPSMSATSGCYESMFAQCTGLTTAPALPATTLAKRCYADMFDGCDNLTTAPALPATTLAEQCYIAMFRGCNSLTTTPELPSATLTRLCYAQMFESCTSLQTPPVLSATTLEDSCYGTMFRYCSGLTSAPALPATTLAGGCYQNMFEGCTSLTSAPVLSAITLTSGCYLRMFKGCTGITTAPDLPAETLVQDCYREMFYGCSSLNYIKAMFTTTPSTSYTANWVDGVFPAGTFVKNANATYADSALGLPNAWTVETAEP